MDKSDKQWKLNKLQKETASLKKQKHLPGASVQQCRWAKAPRHIA